jgi:prefoldin subunit 5
MDAINVIDAKLNEIASKIRTENKNIKLTHKQCAQMAKILAKSQKRKR